MPPRSARFFRAAPFVLIAAILSGGAHAHPGTDIALTDLTALIAAAPTEAELYVRRSLCYVEHSRWPEADADLDRAAQLDASLASLPLARAEYHFARTEFAAAIRVLTPIISAQPDIAAARILRARAHAAAGHRPAALADFRASLLAPPEPKPELWLEANALITDPASSLADISVGIARLGPAPALVERALARELELRRYDAALTRLDQLAATAERPEFFLKRRGDLLASLGRTADARAAYTAALHALQRLPSWLQASESSRQLAAQLTALISPAT